MQHRLSGIAERFVLDALERDPVGELPSYETMLGFGIVGVFERDGLDRLVVESQLVQPLARWIDQSVAATERVAFELVPARVRGQVLLDCWNLVGGTLLGKTTFAVSVDPESCTVVVDGLAESPLKRHPALERAVEGGLLRFTESVLRPRRVV